MGLFKKSKNKDKFERQKVQKTPITQPAAKTATKVVNATAPKVAATPVAAAPVAIQVKELAPVIPPVSTMPNFKKEEAFRHPVIRKESYKPPVLETQQTPVPEPKVKLDYTVAIQQDTDQNLETEPLIEEKPKRKPSGNFCVRLYKKTFFHFFPNKNRPTSTTQGRQLRLYLSHCCVFHLIFFLISVWQIGFNSVVISMGLAAICFSCYLTLRSFAITCYIAACLFSSFEIIMYFKFNKFTNNIKVVFSYLHAVGTALAAFYTFRAWYHFKATGGIHGIDAIWKKKKKMEDTLLGRTQIAIDDAIEKCAADQRAEDLEIKKVSIAMELH